MGLGCWNGYVYPKTCYLKNPIHIWNSYCPRLFFEAAAELDLSQTFRPPDGRWISKGEKPLGSRDEGLLDNIARTHEHSPRNQTFADWPRIKKSFLRCHKL